MLVATVKTRDDPADAAAPGDDADGHRDRRHPRHDADVLQAATATWSAWCRDAQGCSPARCSATTRPGSSRTPTTSSSTATTRTPRSASTPAGCAGLPRRAQARLVGHHQVDADRVRPPRRGRRPGAGRGAPRAARWTACSRPTGWSTCPGTAGTSHRGEHRLRYDEAFTVQAVLAQRRRANDEVRDHAAPSASGRSARVVRPAAAVRADRGPGRRQRADRRRAGPGAPDAPAAAG